VFGGAVMIAGCFSPSAPANAPCGPATGGPRCPAGLICVDELCVPPGATGGDGGGDSATDGPLPIDGNPLVDTDGDGVFDDTDNCRDVANANQENEDGDSFGDACDPCPVLPDAAIPIDSDGDGISDPCDPHPLAGGDTVFKFEPFAGATVPTGWRQFNTWSVAGGVASASGADGEHASLRFPSNAPGSDLVMAAFTVIEDHSTASYAGAGVVVRHGNNSDNAIACQVTSEPNGAQRLSLTETLTETHFEQADLPFVVGSRYVVKLIRNGTSFECSAQKEGQAVVTISDTDALSPAMPEYGIRLRGDLVNFEWVYIVAGP